MAIKENTAGFLEKLIASGINVSSVSTIGDVKLPALHYSMYEGHIESTRLLIDSGADVNSVYTIGAIELPALHYSVIMKNIDATKLLMEYGANVNMKSSSNVTAIEYASDQNNFDAVRELLKVGALSSELESDGYILDFIGESILFGLSILSKVINNEYFTDFVKIGEEEMLFMKDPIDYILTHNDVVSIALNAMDNLMLHENLVELHPQILETKECLS